MTVDKDAIVQRISKMPGISQKGLCDWFVSEKHVAAKQTFLKALDELTATGKINRNKSGRSVTYTSCNDMTKKELEKTLECVLNRIEKKLCKKRTEIPKWDYHASKEILGIFNRLESRIQKNIEDAILDSDNRKHYSLVWDRSGEIGELLKNLRKKDKDLKNQIFKNLQCVNRCIRTEMFKLQYKYNEQIDQYHLTRDKRKRGSVEKKSRISVTIMINCMQMLTR